MKEISVGVCLNEYTWLEIWEKKKSGLFKKTKWKKIKFEKKNGLGKKKKMKKRKEVVVQFEFYYVKLVELVLFEKKLCSTSF